MGKWTMMTAAYDAWRAAKGGKGAIAARQSRRLAELVAHARKHSRFFAEKYRHLPEQITDVTQLPVVTKREMMARFEDWVTDPAITRPALDAFLSDLGNVGKDFLGKYGVWTTSGSTGVPAILIHDRHSLDLMAGVSLVRGNMSMQEFREILRRGSRIAGVYATGGHFLGYASVQRRKREKPNQPMDIYSVLDPLPETVRRLNAAKPAMLGGYPTALQLLAEEQQAGRLDIHPVMINTGGEWLSAETRTKLETAFGCKVNNTYGCSESGTMAFDCGHGWMHVNADWVILEPVDEHYRPVPPGQMSHSTLITYLGNKVQPILRYELGDRVMINPELCACGSPLPAIRVEGRTDDLLTLGGVRVLPLALFALVKAIPGVHRFQLIQTGPAHLDVRLEADTPEVWEHVRQRLLTFLEQQGVASPTLSLSAEQPQPDARSGKFRHVWSAFK